MFGADTHLVFDALQMVGIAVVATGGAVWLLMRRRQSTEASEKPASPIKGAAATNLEERVRVLERIATDSSSDLAEEIEALRTPKASRNTQLEGQDL